MQLYSADINILRDQNLEPNPLNSGALERSILLEYYSRNALTLSNFVDAGNWATVTPNATTAPDGTMTGIELAEQAFDVYHHCITQIVNIVSAPYSMSIFAKSGTRTKMWMNNTSFPDGNEAIINLTTGTVISGPTWGTVEILDAGNGWWEIRYIFTPDLPNDILAWGTVNDANQTSFPGDVTKHIYLWNITAFCNRPCATSSIISVTNQAGSPPPPGFSDPGEFIHGTGRWLDSPLQIPFAAAPQAMSGLFEFVEKGTALTAGAGLWSIGDYVLSSPSLQLGVGASGYRIIHNNGGNVTSSLAAFPTMGQPRAAEMDSSSGWFSPNLAIN